MLSWKRDSMVCQGRQLEIARKLGLQNVVLVGDERLRASFKRWDNFVESLIGGVYLDAGGDERGSAATKDSVYKLWGLE